MSLKIVTYPNPLLGKPSLPITEVTDEIRKLAEEMTEAMYKSDGIGIAAPQVGRLIRLVIIDVTGPEKREGKMVLVNPVWTPLPDAGYVESEEGCLSVPDYRSKVRRTARVHVEATDLDGNPVSFDADDILAICVQHEIDHLDGKLFIDRISRLKRIMFENKLKKVSLSRYASAFRAWYGSRTRAVGLPVLLSESRFPGSRPCRPCACGLSFSPPAPFPSAVPLG